MNPTNRVFLGEYIYYSNRKIESDDIAIAIYLELKNSTQEKVAKLFKLNTFTVKAFHCLNNKDKQVIEEIYKSNLTKKCIKCLSYLKLDMFHERRDYKENICLLCKSKERRYFPLYTEEELLEHKRIYKKRFLLKEENRLRANISKSIAKMLKNQKSNKQGESILKYLDYSFEDLKKHLENLFDSNMNWENYGPYRKDKYTWSLDHIKCQSDYPYKSMTDDNFKIVWELNNLRPLETKINCIEGSRRTRHLKK